MKIANVKRHSLDSCYSTNVSLGVMWWFEREPVLIGSGVWIPGPLLRELSVEAVDPLGVAFMEDVPCWGQVWRDTSLTHFQSLSLRPMCGEKCGP